MSKKTDYSEYKGFYKFLVWNDEHKLVIPAVSVVITFLIYYSVNFSDNPWVNYYAIRDPLPYVIAAVFYGGVVGFVILLALEALYSIMQKRRIRNMSREK